MDKITNSHFVLHYIGATYASTSVRIDWPTLRMVATPDTDTKMTIHILEDGTTYTKTLREAML
jgi:hypothetical protein